MPEQNKISSSRPMGKEEHSKWQKVRFKMNRTIDLISLCNSQLKIIVKISQFCDDNGINLEILSEMPDLEKNFLETEDEAVKLFNAVHDAELGYLGVVYKSGDFDLIQPTKNTMSGFGFPPLVVAAIGIVSVTTILARWIYLEHRVEDISEKYNKIIKTADSQLCANPKSDTCKKWKNRKLQDDFSREVTISEEIKNGIKTAGKGLSAAFLIAIPIFAFSFFGRNR